MSTTLSKSQLGDVFYHSHATNSSHTRGVGVGAFHVFVFAHAGEPTKLLHKMFTNSMDGCGLCKPPRRKSCDQHAKRHISCFFL